jgi:hypothetical protein
MRVTPPVVINTITSSTAAEPHAPAAYAGGTTYALGAIISVAADFAIYESLADSNTGNTPSTSPIWWRAIGVTETAYNAATTYALGDTVSSASTHRVYESLAAGNLGNPLPVLPETTTTKWLDVGPTDKYACVDLSRNTQTVTASPMTVVFAPGERINTIGVVGMSANELVLKATSVSTGGIVYPLPYSATTTYAAGECMTVGLTTCYQSLVDGNIGHAAPDASYWTVVTGYVFDLNTRQVADAYDYAFEPFSTDTARVVFDVPPISDVVITVTLSATAGNVKLGGIVVGTYIYIGEAQYEAGNDGLNFSTISRDLYGNATLVKRRTLPKTSQQLVLPSYRVNKAMAARVLLNATPALWTGLDDASEYYFDMLTILGVYKQFEIKARNMDKAVINLELEEI